MVRKKILYLTVSELPFKTMEMEIKDREYRKPSKWIRSRLIDKKTGKPKKYDLVKITHGYGNDKKYLVFSYLGFEVSKKNYMVRYETGLLVNVRKGDYRILLGALKDTGNIDSKRLF